MTRIDPQRVAMSQVAGERFEAKATKLASAKVASARVSAPAAAERAELGDVLANKTKRATRVKAEPPPPRSLQTLANFCQTAQVLNQLALHDPTQGALLSSAVGSAVGLLHPLAQNLLGGLALYSVASSYEESKNHHRFLHQKESPTFRKMQDYKGGGVVGTAIRYSGEALQALRRKIFAGVYLIHHGWHHLRAYFSHTKQFENKADQKKADAKLANKGDTLTKEELYGQSLSKMGFVRWIAPSVPAYAATFAAAHSLGAANSWSNGAAFAAGALLPILAVPFSSMVLHPYYHLREAAAMKLSSPSYHVKDGTALKLASPLSHWLRDHLYKPAMRWFIHTPFFRVTSLLHQDHHTDGKQAYNLLLPIGDLLRGTFRLPPPQTVAQAQRDRTMI